MRQSFQERDTNRSIATIFDTTRHVSPSQSCPWETSMYALFQVAAANLPGALTRISL